MIGRFGVWVLAFEMSCNDAQVKLVSEPKACTSQLGRTQLTFDVSLLPVLYVSEVLEIVVLHDLVVDLLVMLDELLAGEHLGRGLLHGDALGALDEESVQAPDVAPQLGLGGEGGVTAQGVADEAAAGAGRGGGCIIKCLLA